jgi:hypothetical protein
MEEGQVSDMGTEQNILYQKLWYTHTEKLKLKNVLFINLFTISTISTVSYCI